MAVAAGPRGDRRAGSARRPTRTCRARSAGRARAIIAEQLENAGFSEHHVEPLDFPVDFRSPADWWTQTIACSNRFATAIDGAPDDVVDGIAERLDEHAARFRLKDGTLRLPARTWVAWATA